MKTQSASMDCLVSDQQEFKYRNERTENYMVDSEGTDNSLTLQVEPLWGLEVSKSPK
jgi:hypothetical protein